MNVEEITYILRGMGVHLQEEAERRPSKGREGPSSSGEWYGFRNDTEEPVVIVGIYGGGSDEGACFEEHSDNSGPAIRD